MDSLLSQCPCLNSGFFWSMYKQWHIRYEKCPKVNRFFLEEFCKKFNISLPELKFLIALEEKGPMMSSQIGRKNDGEPNDVTGILDKLERKDLIIRSRDFDDRRMVSISITEAGKELVRKHKDFLKASSLVLP